MLACTASVSVHPAWNVKLQEKLLKLEPDEDAMQANTDSISQV